MKIKIGIADDQQLFLRSLSALINSFHDFGVIVEALDGQELLQRLGFLEVLPDIILVDVKMPHMDGPAVVKKVRDLFPSIKSVALTMKEDEQSILSMFRAGCSAYLLKDVHPKELEQALMEVQHTGYYNGDALSVHYRRLLRRPENQELKITDREKSFLTLACSDLTYKEIASRMFLSEKTVDGYRESLFQKFNVKSRVGMALEAIRRNLVTI